MLYQSLFPFSKRNHPAIQTTAPAYLCSRSNSSPLVPSTRTNPSFRFSSEFLIWLRRTYPLIRFCARVLHPSQMLRSQGWRRLPIVKRWVRIFLRIPSAFSSLCFEVTHQWISCLSFPLFGTYSKFVTWINSYLNLNSWSFLFEHLFNEGKVSAEQTQGVKELLSFIRLPLLALLLPHEAARSQPLPLYNRNHIFPFLTDQLIALG